MCHKDTTCLRRGMGFEGPRGNSTGDRSPHTECVEAPGAPVRKITCRGSTRRFPGRVSSTQYCTCALHALLDVLASRYIQALTMDEIGVDIQKEVRCLLL